MKTVCNAVRGTVFVHPYVASEEKSGAAAGLVIKPVHVKRQEAIAADF